MNAVHAYPLRDRVATGFAALGKFKNPFNAIAYEGLRRPIGDLQRGKYLARVTTLSDLFQRLSTEQDTRGQEALSHAIKLLWLELGMRISDRIHRSESSMAAIGIVKEEREYVQRCAQQAAEFLIQNPQVCNKAKENVLTLLLPYPVIHEAFKP